MPPLPITITAAAFLLLIAIPLSLQVTFRRIKLGNIVFGDADDAILRRRVRAHANFNEYAPLGVVALALLEGSGAWSSSVVGVVAVALVGARLLHAVGMLYGRTPALRAMAMMATHACFLVTGGGLLYAVSGS